MSGIMPLYSCDRSQMMDFTSSAASATMDSRSTVRSCSTCSKAKAKCVKRPGQQICDRCARLGKECQSKEPVIRRRKVSKPTRTAQLEKLENKIEHLVHALTAQQSQHVPDQPASPSSTAQSGGHYGHRPSQVLGRICPKFDDERGTLECNSNAPSPGVMTAIGTKYELQHASEMSQDSLMPTELPIDCHSLLVSMDEAEILLDRYRRLMSPALPFVVLPEGVTAPKLYEQKPFLLHVITTVAYFHDLPKQQKMVKHVMRDVSERVLINSEKNVGLLQGILVLISWYYPHVFWLHQATNLLHLAIAMTIDLGIDRSPHQSQDFRSATGKSGFGSSTAVRVPTADEHRVLAGIFFLTSMLGSTFKKLDATAYTKYLENCLESLVQIFPESDLFLVQLVRLQHLIEEMHKVVAPAAPIQMYVKAYEADLAKLKASDPCKDTSNIYLQMQYLNAEILVWELNLEDLQEHGKQPLRSHLDDLYRCLEAIKAFVELYFSIPISAYLTLPFSTYAQFGHAFVTFTKLASLDLNGWDMQSSSLNLIEFVEEAANRFAESTKSKPDGLRINNDCLAKWATRVRWMGHVHEAKYATENDKGSAEQNSDGFGRRTPQKASPQPTEDLDGNLENAAQAMLAPQQPTPPDDVMSSDFLSWLDENFWSSFGVDFNVVLPEMGMS